MPEMPMKSSIYFDSKYDVVVQVTPKEYYNRASRTLSLIAGNKFSFVTLKMMSLSTTVFICTSSASCCVLLASGGNMCYLLYSANAPDCESEQHGHDSPHENPVSITIYYVAMAEYFFLLCLALLKTRRARLVQRLPIFFLAVAAAINVTILIHTVVKETSAILEHGELHFPNAING